MGLLLLGLLFVSTGLINALTGATSPTMLTSNRGEMHDQIYVHTEELRAAQWLAENRLPQTLIQSGYFGGTRLYLAGLDRPLMRDVFAWSVDKNSYLFRGTHEMESGEALVYFAGAFMRYLYPSAEIESGKGVIYTNGNSEIYR